jgi:hypothetical protein
MHAAVTRILCTILVGGCLTNIAPTIPGALTKGISGLLAKYSLRKVVNKVTAYVDVKQGAIDTRLVFG